MLNLIQYRRELGYVALPMQRDQMAYLMSTNFPCRHAYKSFCKPCNNKRHGPSINIAKVRERNFHRRNFRSREFRRKYFQRTFRRTEFSLKKYIVINNKFDLSAKSYYISQEKVSLTNI